MYPVVRIEHLTKNYYLESVTVRALRGVTLTVNQGDFSLMGLLVSLGGAIILLFVVNLIRRGTAGPRV